MADPGVQGTPLLVGSSTKKYRWWTQKWKWTLYLRTRFDLHLTTSKTDRLSEECFLKLHIVYHRADSQQGSQGQCALITNKGRSQLHQSLPGDEVKVNYYHYNNWLSSTFQYKCVGGMDGTKACTSHTIQIVLSRATCYSRSVTIYIVHTDDQQY